jgi:hypothetical protein
MTNKILGLSILVALIGAIAALTPPLYGALMSNESNVVYAQEQQQLQTGAAADDPMKHFSGTDWWLKVNINGLSPQSAPVTIHLYGAAGSGFSDTSTLSYAGNQFTLFAVNGNLIHIGDQYQVCVDQNGSNQRCQTLVHNAGDESLDVSVS